MTRHDHDNPIDPLEALLGEALSPEALSDDLAARIIARTAGQNSQQPTLKLVGQEQIEEPIASELEPILDEALAPPAVPGGLVKRIIAATLPLSDQIVARIGPLRVRYATAQRFAAMVVVAASLGIVMQAWGICTDAYHIVQATRHVASIMKYTAPDTSIDQQIDQLSTQIDQLALTDNHDDWSTQVGEMNKSIMGLEKLIESETGEQTF
jgi:hypothetical protein